MIELQGVTLRQGDFVLKSLDLNVATGDHAVLMGRSGSGKTSILEMICGLRRVAGGTIRLMGRDVTALPPAQRGIGYVPQDGAIFTTMRVRDQIGFGLELRDAKPAQIRARVEELAELLGIQHLLQRYPPGLSGGERQRIALGRALAFGPQVLCLDEPTSALDDETRDEILDVIRRAREHAGATVLHVSHSQYEAQQLADVVWRLQEGRLVQATQVSA